MLDRAAADGLHLQVRFFIVPVGKRCRDLGLAQRLAHGDAKYASLLMGEAWGSCFDKNDGEEGEECVWDEHTGALVEEGIMEYLRGAHDTLMLEIAEVSGIAGIGATLPCHPALVLHAVMCACGHMRNVPLGRVAA